MRCAVPGTRRERVPATGALTAPSGCSRNSAGGPRLHEVAQPGVHCLGVGAREHVEIDARDAGLARGARAQQAAQLRRE